MNETVVKQTQDTLGKIIGKKPPLTDKLLNRPPFRFLHDIITSVIKQTGFMKGLFTDKESAAESITSKDEKIAFLQKAIDITANVTGKKLSVRPSKIVAGLEAEKTNEFLQAIAEAVNKKPDNDACVKKILSGGDSDSSAKSKDSKSKDNERERSADRRKRHSEKESSEKKRPANSSVGKDKENKEKSDRRDRDKDKEKDRDRDKDSRRHRDSSKDGRRESSRNRESSHDGKERDASRDRKERERSSRHRRKDQSDDSKEQQSSQNSAQSKETEKQSKADADDGDDVSQETDEEPHANRIPRPSSAKGSRRKHREGRSRPSDDLDDDDNSKMKSEPQNDDTETAVPPQVEQSRRLVRPSSARPAPPKVKRQEAAQDTLTERVDSARTQRVENVIVDDSQHSDDDDNFVVEESNQENITLDREEAAPLPTEEDGEHGGLVKKILESKKEFDQTQQAQQTKTKIDKSSVNEATRQKEREMVRKEVEKLRSSIQTLTRSANPLGKIMDYIQEDLHSMQKERDTWKTENRKLMEQIKQEMSVTDSSIEPLKSTLSQIDQALSDQLDMIAAVKHNIIENDEKIAKMLSSVTHT